MAVISETLMAEPPTQLDQKAPMDTTTTSTDTMSTPTEPTKAEDTASAQIPIRKPFPLPADSAKPSPPPELTPDQTKKYNTLLTTASSWTEIPTTSAKNSPKAPITDSERQWLTRECLLRYLRATKWSLSDATNRLLSTLTWRREYNLQSFTPEYISPENETGKQFILGFDNAGRPCLYLNPGRQNSKRSEKQVQHLVFMLERCIDLMPAGQETLCLMINYVATSSGNSGPSVGQGRQVLNILQSHYPERLGRALIINVPWFIWTFFKLITPFIDPLTREKLKFNDNLRLHAPPEQLPTTHGGDIAFEYDHAEYWPALCSLAEERRKEMEERWIRGGKRVGEYEAYLRGGLERGVGGAEGAEATSSTNEAATAKITEGMAEMAVNGESNKMETPGLTEEAPVMDAEKPAMTTETAKVAEPVASS